MLLSVHLEIVLILTQDRCKFCTECTLVSKIILDAPDGTPRCSESCGISLVFRWETCYCLFKIVPLGDMLLSVQDRSTVCAKRTIGSEIILDAPDANPR